jgi:Ca2+-binding EF-hand superfamily protein
MVFAVANIVNGVFVDGAIELAKRDRTTMMQKQRERDENKESHLVDLLTIMDSDGDNLITDEEFLESLEKQEIRDYISALDVEINDAKEFFQLLDADGSGQVDIIEFVTGMQKFRGEAKSIDIHMMLHENRKLFKVVGGLVGALMEQWEGQEGPGDSNDCDSKD